MEPCALHNDAAEPVLTYAERGGKSVMFALVKDVHTIGRSAACRIVIQDPTVARLHARVERCENTITLFDMGSAHGTFVNGLLLTKPRRLQHGDLVGLGVPVTHLRFTAHRLATAHQTLAFDEQTTTFSLCQQPLRLSSEESCLFTHLYTHQGDLCSVEGCLRRIWPELEPSPRATRQFERLVMRLNAVLRGAVLHYDAIEQLPGVGIRLRRF